MPPPEALAADGAAPAEEAEPGAEPPGTDMDGRSARVFDDPELDLPVSAGAAPTEPPPSAEVRIELPSPRIGAGS